MSLACIKINPCKWRDSCNFGSLALNCSFAALQYHQCLRDFVPALRQFTYPAFRTLRHHRIFCPPSCSCTSVGTVQPALGWGVPPSLPFFIPNPDFRQSKLLKCSIHTQATEAVGCLSPMALQPYVPPGSASATSIINYAGREISEEEREKRIKDVRNSLLPFSNDESADQAAVGFLLNNH